MFRKKQKKLVGQICKLLLSELRLLKFYQRSAKLAGRRWRAIKKRSRRLFGQHRRKQIKAGAWLLPSRRDNRRLIVNKTVNLGLVLLVLWLAFNLVGVTGAFFNDTETSLGNYWRMATLYIDADRVNFTPTVSDTQIATAGVVVDNHGRLKIKYNTTLQNATGVLCPALNLMISRSGSGLLYDGPIQAAATWSDNSLVAGGSGDYNLAAIMTTNDETLQNQTCQFSLIFQGWQEEITDFTSGGYTDQTIVQLTINSGEWQQPDNSCTLTQGYWQTHSKYGPAPYDDTWALLEEDTPFYLSGQTYYQVIWTPPAGGNAYYILAPQYIAAGLNQLNGATVPEEVQTALTEAIALFGLYTPADIGALAANDELKQQFISLAELLDDYNNGSIGPGHCDEFE